ncbi:MAG: type II toxin-antitoxin system Phd/YefM family antitoxin [Candidatus Sericytochromatia bacterium]|uniref:Type II toxin-antitoxin system Phd/YefM family antitoxin n=1 Tax=Candidatus Tanganyikabacteria bacterium TaxID=2961651 RepID=A0A937X762_9BACT|nr:type II toxin-antitoxin system Phd/YefM family antitoxin [Candidatus Tanganyikabacteria bacterium]
MIRLNVHEAKTHLSRYLENVERGETIILCRRNVAIAEIRPLGRPCVASRTLGAFKGGAPIPDAVWFEPLPTEEIGDEPDGDALAT